MSGSVPLSVAVITHNEERNLGRCLGSVRWASEIVVVDAMSDDSTVAIAERFGARVFRRPWPGFVAQKNFAIERTSAPWVLSLDADEWLTAEGAQEIREVLARPTADAFALNRRSAFSGAFLQRTWSRDWQVRLFRRDCARFAGGPVHERLTLAGGARVARLRQRLPHLAYRSLHDYVARMNRYTDLAAAGLAAAGRPVPWGRLLLSPPATFVKLFVLRGGFLDGVRGLVVSAGSAYSVLLKYAKLWEHTRPEDEELAACLRVDDGSTDADHPAPERSPGR